MTYLIEYLGEFEFIFETVLGYVSGDQMGYFEAKKTESKISCLGTFQLQIILRPVSLGVLFLVCKVGQSLELVLHTEEIIDVF